MKCRDVQLMLPDFVMNKISNGQVSKVEAHLSECPLCKQAADDIHEVMLGLRDAKIDEPSEQYFATILPRVHQRISESGKSFLIPGFVLRFLLPVALILITVVVLSNYNRMFAPPTLADNSQGVASVVSDSSSYDDLASIYGQSEYQTDDNITTTDKDVLSDIITTSSESLPITEDDASSLAVSFSKDDFHEFYALLEKQ